MHIKIHTRIFVYSFSHPLSPHPPTLCMKCLGIYRKKAENTKKANSNWSAGALKRHKLQRRGKAPMAPPGSAHSCHASSTTPPLSHPLYRCSTLSLFLHFRGQCQYLSQANGSTSVLAMYKQRYRMHTHCIQIPGQG